MEKNIEQQYDRSTTGVLLILHHSARVFHLRVYGRVRIAPQLRAFLTVFSIRCRTLKEKARMGGV